MKNLFSAFRSVCLLLAAMLCLAACGKKETTPEAIVNWTLPDVASFEENYSSEKETAAAEKPAQETENYRWKPHGVYTYVYGTSGEDGSWSTALFKISSADYEKHFAIVTYTVRTTTGFPLPSRTGRTRNRKITFLSPAGKRWSGWRRRTMRMGRGM